MSEDIEKLKYQVNLLISLIDHNKHPVESMVLDLNWSDEDLDDAHDIFEKYDDMIEKGEDINWHTFEHELRDKFNIGYQTVKTIINSFYNNNQWSAVSYQYAKEYKCVEFHRLIKDYEQI